MSGAHKQTGDQTPFMAFTSDAESTEVLKRFAAEQGWDAGNIRRGDILAAAELLKQHPSPRVLCVDVASAEAAAPALDKLADVCDPGIKVIVSGNINEYSFYRSLIDMGIADYLLKPFTMEALTAAYAKATEVPAAAGASVVQDVKKDAKIIAVIGARGGVGATTVSVNLGWILANTLDSKTALLDFDPQLGTVALALDLEPGKGLRDALEKPDRIDGLFIDRVMIRLDDKLSILSSEEGLNEDISGSESAAEALFKQMRPKFGHIIVDVPRSLTPFTRYALKHADHIVCVTELTIMSLRESLRYLDYCRDTLKVGLPTFVANRVGLAGRHQMPLAEFEKGLGTSVSYSIPFVLEAHSAATAGEVLVESPKSAPATKVLQAIANQFAGDASRTAPAKKGLMGFLKGGK